MVVFANPPPNEMRLYFSSQPKQPVPHKHPYERSRQAKPSREGQKHLSAGDIHFGGPFIVLGRHARCVRVHKRLIHDSPVSIQTEPAENHDHRPERFVRMAVHDALDIFATNLGRRLRAGVMSWNASRNFVLLPSTSTL
jgi:hypothetical protein